VRLSLKLRYVYRFEQKGYFSGGFNHIEGKIFTSQEKLYRIHGKWSDTIYIVNEASKEESILFAVEGREIFPKNVKDEASQEDYESRRYI
jgi:hypothetical protein